MSFYYNLILTKKVSTQPAIVCIAIIPSHTLFILPPELNPKEDNNMLAPLIFPQESATRRLLLTMVMPCLNSGEAA